MESKLGQITLNRTKNTHSLSAIKLQIPEKKDQNPLPHLNAGEIISQTPRQKGNQFGSFSSYLSPKLDTKRKNFYEIIGVSSPKDKNAKPHELKVEVSTPKISITDFMGKTKYSLYKQAGCMGIYGEYKKNNEFQKLIDQKHTLSLPNIVHTDMIRENAIKNPHSPRISEISTLFQKPKYSKQVQGERSDAIQHIIDECDNLYKEGKKFKNVKLDVKLDEASFRVKVCKRKRRLTVQEKYLIRRQIENF